MSNDRFLFHEITACRNQGHKLRVVGSDKTPMKKHLVCDTCSVASGKSVFVAYGEPLKSWGDWQRPPRKHEEEQTA